MYILQCFYNISQLSVKAYCKLLCIVKGWVLITFSSSVKFSASISRQNNNYHAGMNEHNVLVSDHVSHPAVKMARHSAHNVSVPADIKVGGPSFAFRRIQVPAQFRQEQYRSVVIVVVQ